MLVFNISEKIVKQTAKELEIDEDLVDKLVRHQWGTTLEGLHQQKDVEVSGFCKFKLRHRNVKKKIAEVRKIIEGKIRVDHEMQYEGQQQITRDKTLDALFSDLRFLMAKLTEDEQDTANIRGLEESLSSTRRAKRADRDSF